MKRIVILFMLLLFTQLGFTQKMNQSSVPAVIVNAFHLKFPNATDVNWKKDKKNYQINYKVNNKDHQLKLSYKGHVLEHFQDLFVSEIPEFVLETIKSKVPYYDIRDADKIKKGSRVLYSINFRLDGKMRFFWIGENGKLIKYRWELKNSEIPLSILNVITNRSGKMDVDYAKYVEEGERIIYIISGEIDGDEHKFTIDNKSKIIKHTADIKDKYIPEIIIKSVASNYQGYEIRDAYLLEEKGNKTFTLKIKKSNKQIFVTFNSSGEILKEE